jgi:hypothetical protein
LSRRSGAPSHPAGFKPFAGWRRWRRELRRTQEGQMAKTKSNSKAAARSKAPMARSSTGSSESVKAASENPPSSVSVGRTSGTKQNLIIGLLQREQGASVPELAAATGWLPHTTRAALTRLRQSGHELLKEKRDTGETAYRAANPGRQTRPRKAA